MSDPEDADRRAADSPRGSDSGLIGEDEAQVKQERPNAPWMHLHREGAYGWWNRCEATVIRNKVYREPAPQSIQEVMHEPATLLGGPDRPDGPGSPRCAMMTG